MLNIKPGVYTTDGERLHVPPASIDAIKATKAVAELAYRADESGVPVERTQELMAAIMPCIEYALFRQSGELLTMDKDPEGRHRLQTKTLDRLKIETLARMTDDELDELEWEELFSDQPQFVEMFRPRRRSTKTS